MAESVFQIRNISKTYHMGEFAVHALQSVDLDLYRGELAVLLGPSGSGKSTLLNIIGGLDTPTDGEVIYADHDLTKATDAQLTVYRRDHVGFVFQFYNLIPSLTALENVELITDIAANPMKAMDALEIVGLKERVNHFPAQLSGGEQQRVAIARALMNDPAIILADEPTGNLDSRQAVEIWQLLRRIAKENGKTVLMVTHEAPGAACADEVIVLKDGKIIGRLSPGGSGDAALVATGYQKLVD